MVWQVLGIPGVIAVFTALFSEQRIIMTADDIGLLSECMHGAGALLYPFRWQHIFVRDRHTSSRSARLLTIFLKRHLGGAGAAAAAEVPGLPDGVDPFPLWDTLLTLR